MNCLHFVSSKQLVGVARRCDWATCEAQYVNNTIFLTRFFAYIWEAAISACVVWWLVDVKLNKVFRIRLDLGGPTPCVARRRSFPATMRGAKGRKPVVWRAVCTLLFAVGCPSRAFSPLRCFSSRFRPPFPRENEAGELVLRDDQLIHVDKWKHLREQND